MSEYRENRFGSAPLVPVGDVPTSPLVFKSLFDANTILKADADNDPEALTVAEDRLVGRITAGVIAALTPAQVMAFLSGHASLSFSLNSQKLTSVADPAFAQDAATKAYVDALIGTGEEVQDVVGAMVTGNTETFITVTYQDGDGTLDFVVPVKDEDDMASNSATHLATQQSIKAYADLHILKSLFDAQTILAATSDNTPAALSVPEQRLVGRITSGNLAALTAAQIRALINVEDDADKTDATNVNAAGAVMETDFGTQTLLRAILNNTPVALTVAEQRIVGRITGQNIAALTAAQILTLINVANGADVTGSNAPQAHGPSHEKDGSDETSIEGLLGFPFRVAPWDRNYFHEQWAMKTHFADVWTATSVNNGTYAQELLKLTLDSSGTNGGRWSAYTDMSFAHPEHNSCDLCFYIISATGLTDSEFRVYLVSAEDIGWGDPTPLVDTEAHGGFKIIDGAIWTSHCDGTNAEVTNDCSLSIASIYAPYWLRMIGDDSYIRFWTRAVGTAPWVLKFSHDTNLPGGEHAYNYRLVIEIKNTAAVQQKMISKIIHAKLQE